MTVQPAPNIPFLCALGRHRPEPLAQWNNGYYFSRCKRCGLDLVRTAFEGWHVPQGSKVVWRAEAPRTARFDAGTSNDTLAAKTEIITNGSVRLRGPEAVSASEDDRAHVLQTPVRTVEFPIREPENATAASDRGLVEADADILDRDVVAMEAHMRDDDMRDGDERDVDLRDEDARADARDASLVDDAEADASDEPARPWMFPGDDERLDAYADRGALGLPIEEVLRSLDTRDPEGQVRVIDEGGSDMLPDIPDLVKPAALQPDSPQTLPDVADVFEEPVAQEFVVEEPAAVAPATPKRPAKAEPVTVPYVIPDFMAEDDGEDLWQDDPVAPAASVSAPAAPAPPPGPHWTETLRRRSEEVRSSGRDMFARTFAPRPPKPDLPKPDLPKPNASKPNVAVPPASLPRDPTDPAIPSGARAVQLSGRSSAASNLFIRQVAAASVVVVGGLILVASVVDGRRDEAGKAAPISATERPDYALAARPAGTPQRSDPRSSISDRLARSAIAAPGTVPRQGYVTASLLNCRSIPANDGPTVRRLTRGAPVQVLGTDWGWVSIAHQGRQCWASATFISETKPG